MKKYLARNHKFYIQDLENWVQISGISTWSVSYSSDIADITKFNNNGWSSSIVTGRSGRITLEGFYLSSSNGVRDYGQNLCDNLSTQLGFYSLKPFKLEAYDDNGSLIGLIITSGIFSNINNGGNVTSLMPWSITVTFKGAPVGSGIYNIFDKETYPAPDSEISRSGMWTGVLGMYTYAE